MKVLKNNPQNAETEYDKLFVDNYSAILKFALQITKHDYELSEDLVQTTYVSLKRNFNKYNSSVINRFDNYLYISLRNSYISYLRKSVLPMGKDISPIFDESSEALLPYYDPRENLKIKETILSICHFACLRKESSISASILILRFFHGYFPSEISKMLLRSRNVIEARLGSARQEVAAYLKKPEKFDFLHKNSFTTDNFNNILLNEEKSILDEIRAVIFSSKNSNCLDINRLKAKFDGRQEPLPRREISHFVGCEKCLDKLNRILGIPELKERHPLNTLGKEIGSESQAGKDSEKTVKPVLVMTARA